jgi:sugar fermentation stimulation protein A
MTGGVYIAIFRLVRRTSARVGSLGAVDFQPGYYFYVGSAQRNMDARLARHARRSKPLRWHIDYLSSRAKMLGAVVLNAPKDAECRLAARLGEAYRRCVPRFGASDCGCAGHLFFSLELA